MRASPAPTATRRTVVRSWRATAPGSPARWSGSSGRSSSPVSAVTSATRTAPARGAGGMGRGPTPATCSALTKATVAQPGAAAGAGHDRIASRARPRAHPRPARAHRMVVGRRLRGDDGDLRPGGRARPPGGRLHRARGLRRVGGVPGHGGRAAGGGVTQGFRPAHDRRTAEPVGVVHRTPPRASLAGPDAGHPLPKRVPRHRRVLGGDRPLQGRVPGPADRVRGSSSASRTSSPPRSPSCSRTVPSTASSARCTASRWRGSWST